MEHFQRLSQNLPTFPNLSQLPSISAISSNLPAIPQINVQNISFFQQSLQDLIKAIRAHRRDEKQFMHQKYIEIQKDARTSDPGLKSLSILKLVYLNLFSFSLSPAAFQIIEVMSRQEYCYKRIGYLAAAQSFHPHTDVLLLTTNQFKKDLTHMKLLNSSLALQCLASIATEDLARECTNDLLSLLSSTRPYIRKKALLASYRIMNVSPDSIRTFLPKIRDLLQDPDPSVLCAAITVICELVNRKPQSVSVKNYLVLAPALYSVLTSSNNNWTLIKVIKILAVLTPLEPRLAKKLEKPLIQILEKTTAKSLVFECCSMASLAMMDYPAVTELCVEKLGDFILDKDLNLKFLGLLAMRRLVKIHPSLIAEHRDLILDCLDDEDIGIRMCALDLISEFVTKRNMREISRILLEKLTKSLDDTLVVNVDSSDSTESTYREELVNHLLNAGNYVRGADGGSYPFLETEEDFEWYIMTIIGGLSKIYGLSDKLTQSIAEQLIEIASRVEIIREVAVATASSLIIAASSSSRTTPSVAQPKTNSAFIDLDALPGSSKLVQASLSELKDEDDEQEEEEEDQNDSESTGRNEMLSNPLIHGYSWIVGEYASHTKDKDSLVSALMNISDVTSLSSCSQSRVIQSCIKILASAGNSSPAELIAYHLSSKLPSLLKHPSPEVQEIASFALSIINAWTEDAEKTSLAVLFENDLKPVNSNLQETLEVPLGLDLETPLFDVTSLAYEEIEAPVAVYSGAGFNGDDMGFHGGGSSSATTNLIDTGEDSVFTKHSNKTTSYRANDPFYLGSENSKRKKASLKQVSGGSKSKEGVDLLGMYDVFQSEKSKTNRKVSIYKDDGTGSSKSNRTLRDDNEILLDDIFGEANIKSMGGDSSVKEKKKKKKKKKKKSLSSGQGGNNVDSLIVFDEPSVNNAPPAGKVPNTIDDLLM